MYLLAFFCVEFQSVVCILVFDPFLPKGPERRSKRGFGPAKAIPQCFSRIFVRLLSSCGEDLGYIYIDIYVNYINLHIMW